MKSEINPVVAGVIILVIVLVVGVFLWSRSNQGVVSGVAAAKSAKVTKADK